MVPVPEDADSPRFRTNIGSVHYAPEKSAIIWKIKQFGGSKEFLMRAELGLPSVKGDDEHGGGMTGGFGGSMGGAQGGKSKRPISVKFEIPYFTTSGIQVRYLKIIEPKVSRSSFYRFCMAPRLLFRVGEGEVRMVGGCPLCRVIRLLSGTLPCHHTTIGGTCGSVHARWEQVLACSHVHPSSEDIFLHSVRPNCVTR